jgi:hypothetical protein
MAMTISPVSLDDARRPSTELPDDVLVDWLIEEGGRGSTPFGQYIVPSSHPAAALARRVEQTVFGEVFGNTPELLAEEYDPYDDASVFICVLDHVQRRIAGAIRLITPSPAGLKSIDDIETGWHEPAADVMARSPFDLDLDNTWDLATLAVAPDYRGESTDGLITLGLLQGVALLAGRHDVRHVVAILDLVVMDVIQTRYHRPMTTFAGLEPANYLDSPASLPIVWDLVDHRQRLELIDPTLGEIGYGGRGLEAVLSHPDWELEHPRRSALAAVG